MSLIFSCSVTARARRFSGLASLGLALILTACGDGDTRTEADTDAGGAGGNTDTDTNSDEAAVPATGAAGIEVSNGVFTLSTSNSTVELTEGQGPVSVSLTLTRQPEHSMPITVAADAVTAADAQQLSVSFTDEQLDTDETDTELRLSLDFDSAPIVSGTRSLRLTATDGTNSPVTTDLILDITPTDRPDIYLLVGQSNMVGSSELDARESDPGQPDEPNARIRQLNATTNGPPNFVDASDFTSPDSIAVATPRFNVAIDPLHDNFNISINGKSNERVGLGLSFAKAALQNTEADIVLIPAAWGDTGFCRRDSNQLEGSGWLANEVDNDAFAGTLLHDRAIARANLVIQETDGILRGILWHQGEADSSNATCAAQYGNNLRDMVASFRSNIVQDARGAVGRGANAEIPFIVGTMSKGVDERGSLVPFSNTKLIVDGFHRNVAETVPFSASVNADDLVPPNFPCGVDSCIHFGAAALREAGTRYYERLRDLLESR